MGLTRERLLDAAEACFEQGEAERVTLDQVARAAGLSRSLIYRHFANRRELAAEVVLRRAQRHLRQAADIIRAQRNLADGIVDGLVFLSRHGRGQAGQDEIEQAALVRQAATHLWAPVLREAQQNGGVREDLDVDATALTLALVAFVRVADQREMLTRFLVPALVATSGRPGKRRPA